MIWAGQPTPCPRGCTKRDPWGTGFTAYTYVHWDCYVSPAQPCSHGGKWYWTSKSLGTAKSNSASNRYKARDKDLCFTIQTHYKVTDRKGAQDQRQKQIQHKLQQDLIKLTTKASNPHHEPNKLLLWVVCTARWRVCGRLGIPSVLTFIDIRFLPARVLFFIHYLLARRPVDILWPLFDKGWSARTIRENNILP